MLTKENVSTYFSENAGAWISDAYEQSGHNYPTPYHRLRVLKKIFHQLDGVNKIADIGCGGGQVAIALAEQGYDVLGIDESENMLDNAREAVKKRDERTQSNVNFLKQSIYDIDIQDFDSMTAMGVIGYFPSDRVLFDIANKSLKKDGYFIVSFRNKIFDLCSVSNYTLRDIDNGEIQEIYDEYRQLLSSNISNDKTLDFIRSLHDITGVMLENGLKKDATIERPSKQNNIEYIGECDPRQSTPNQVKETALQSGFKTIGLHGIHPHLVSPHLNKLLPATVYNQLSDALTPLEDSDVSLTWSSVFIGVFQKIQ